MSESDLPFVEVTVRHRLPCPEDASEEEALRAAEAEFAEVRESDEADLELRYVDATDQEGNRGDH
ncbi:hypothetical protein SG26_20505 (plasmid) [Haloarcula sp. CBA1115]|uniref:hypothetical protein n=1 Tax=unclassified Haloarcula TaxID=2624677 RepID=UPI00059556F4|nr:MULTISPECIES: hypothetical protein [unclassified Haloarcula]AJF28132.1 hypothetical protein SG26_20505 [Haloarcula sp. CBA1115]